MASWKLTGGQVHDCTQAVALLGNVATSSTQSVTADKAFDTNSILQAIGDIGATAVIPPRVNRKPRTVDFHHYKNRNLIERFFCRLKQFRRIATRYDKLAARYNSFVALVAAVVWLA